MGVIHAAGGRGDHPDAGFPRNLFLLGCRWVPAAGLVGCPACASQNNRAGFLTRCQSGLGAPDVAGTPHQLLFLSILGVFGVFPHLVGGISCFKWFCVFGFSEFLGNGGRMAHTPQVPVILGENGGVLGDRVAGRKCVACFCQFFSE